MNLTDTSTNSPHYFYRKRTGTANENRNFYVWVKRVKSESQSSCPSCSKEGQHYPTFLSNWGLDKTNDRIRKNDSASHNRMEKASHEGNIFYLEQYQIMVYQWSLFFTRCILKRFHESIEVI